MTPETGVSERRYRMVVAKVGENKYAVLSLDSTNGKPSQYVVAYNGSRFQCNCPDFLKHIDEPYYACKHIQAVYEALRWFVDDVDMAIEVEIIKKPRRCNNGNGRQNGEEEKPLLIEKNQNCSGTNSPKFFLFFAFFQKIYKILNELLFGKVRIWSLTAPALGVIF